ncbi:MAG: hypothetical protein JKX72_00015 [Robiginitomaculum sp.]|nr:hypothetical protein [Robiginitomaculum sp.]
MLTRSIGIFALILILFSVFNFIISKNKLTGDNTYAFFLFVISFGLIPNLIIDINSVFFYIILLLFFRKIYSLRKPKSIFIKLFDSALWLGVAFLLEPMSILYLVLIYGAIFLFLEYSIRTIVIPVLGFVTPVFLYFTYCFYTDQMMQFERLFVLNFDVNSNFYNTSFYTAVFSLFGIVTLLSVLLKSAKIFSVSNRFKRSWILLLLHLLLSIVFVVSLKTHNGTALIAVSIPTAIIIANWVQSIENKWFAEMVLLTLLIFSFVIHFIV